MRQLPLTDDWFHGAVSLEHRGDGIKPWRIPYRDYDLYPPEGIEGKAEICAGVRLRLRTDSAKVKITFTPLADDAAMDCLAGGAGLQTLRLTAGSTEAVFSSGFPGGKDDGHSGHSGGHFDGESDGHSGNASGVKELEIWLPQNIGMTVSGLWIDGGVAAEPLPDTRPRWITYGSSITQCVAASSPSRTWPALAAAACGYNLTNLGFSGNCHMEPMIGRLIRDLPADFISLCVGVNIYGAGTLSPRMFKPLLIGLLETIRDKHKETPLLVISPIYGTVRETEANGLGFTLPLMREAIRETVDLLRKRGDRYLYYQDGLNWLGPEESAMLTDGLHPGAEGDELMGRRFLKLKEEAFGAG